MSAGTRVRALHRGGARWALGPTTAGSSPCSVEVRLEGERAVGGDAGEQPGQAGGGRGAGGSGALGEGPVAAHRLTTMLEWAAEEWPSSEAGVPERRAHSEPSGPPGQPQQEAQREDGGAAEREAADARAPRRAGPVRAERAHEHGGDDDREAGDAKHEQPGGFDVAAGPERVQHCDRPAGVGEPVRGAPRAAARGGGAAGW